MRRLGVGSLTVLGLAALVAVLVVAASIGLALPVVAVLVTGVALAVLAGLAAAGPGHLVVLVGAGTALAVALARAERLGPGFAIAVALVIAAAAADEPLARRLAPTVRTAQLPGVRSDLRPSGERPFLGSVTIAVALSGIAAALSPLLAPDSVGLQVVGALVALVVAVLVGAAALRLRTMVRAIGDGTADHAVTAALQAYAPEFVLHFSGPVEGDYQIRMWLPYLSRLDRRWVILTRDHRMLARAADLDGQVPMVSCPRLSALDGCMVDSIRAVFHVNTDHQCVDLVRFADRTQVQLNHGDSDKPSSRHPMIAMFDQVFVAGQAAIDRFVEHGVTIPPEKFVVVGRPQVADIVATNVEPHDQVSVLYAPTWRGGTTDMSLSSLARGVEVVEALLGLGVRVMFRPHPYSLREAGSAAAVARIDARLAAAGQQHLASKQTVTGSMADWFNRSDALVGDVSSVPVDYLQSGKPLAVTDLGDPGESASGANTSGILQGAYVLHLGGDLHAPLAAMVGDDPLAEQRARVRTHYLGDIPTDELVPHFLAAATAAIDG
ncbi:MAG TPA: CDP-glycerol glycerophosphotransferase family protein [Candidatus Avipropionibacterium avicola]|uniref:CDP-glycerol glycerophosphotransferase family protein n=1 Tax=Candidatus Avipropionibacterium avicola TaxID=2840701 RepID=A0A9D1GZW5_9ACTN|nr:CDP-glycerol glycerophosphotransferase family protein [Candidatus Avipropionibacterium avicola]